VDLHVPKPLGEYSFNFTLDSGNPHSPDATEMAAPDEDVSVGPAAFADEHFLIEPESGIADASWSVDHAEHVPHEAAQLVAPEYPGAGTEAEPEEHVHSLGEFSDDPVDTKLDLARAYLDMGDAEGAQAMLGEVMREGSQMQRDTARALLEKID
jgi:pilus assembly protein FimV